MSLLRRRVVAAADEICHPDVTAVPIIRTTIMTISAGSSSAEASGQTVISGGAGSASSSLSGGTSRVTEGKTTMGTSSQDGTQVVSAANATAARTGWSVSARA